MQVDGKAQPRFYKPRTVPYAIQSRVEELARLEREGILEPVTHSEWAAPVVPIIKQYGSVRLCGDYKLTINQAAVVERYPLPRIEDMLSCLAKGKVLSKLDLSHAYMQLALKSKKYVTISSQKGLFQYTKLPFGITSAPAVFQRTMECILQGIPNTIVYISGWIIRGRSFENFGGSFVQIGRGWPKVIDIVCFHGAFS